MSFDQLTDDLELPAATTELDQYSQVPKAPVFDVIRHGPAKKLSEWRLDERVEGERLSFEDTGFGERGGVHSLRCRDGSIVRLFGCTQLNRGLLATKPGEFLSIQFKGVEATTKTRELYLFAVGVFRNGKWQEAGLKPELKKRL